MSHIHNIVLASLILAFGTGASANATENIPVKSLAGDFARDGTLHFPEGIDGKVPAVVFIPGTDGVDQRFDFHRPGLLSAGIAVLEIDTKTRVFTSEKDRPKNEFVEPIALGALKALQGHPRIDPRASQPWAGRQARRRP